MIFISKLCKAHGISEVQFGDISLPVETAFEKDLMGPLIILSAEQRFTLTGFDGKGFTFPWRLDQSEDGLINGLIVEKIDNSMPMSIAYLFVDESIERACALSQSQGHATSTLNLDPLIENLEQTTHARIQSEPQFSLSN